MTGGYKYKCCEYCLPVNTSAHNQCAVWRALSTTVSAVWRALSATVSAVWRAPVTGAPLVCSGGCHSTVSVSQDALTSEGVTSPEGGIARTVLASIVEVSPSPMLHCAHTVMVYLVPSSSLSSCIATAPKSCSATGNTAHCCDLCQLFWRVAHAYTCTVDDTSARQVQGIY